MNILITGGAGYIGTALVYQLNEDPLINQIVIYDNLSRPNYNLLIGKTKLKANKVRFVEGDILDSRKLKKEIDKANIVFHLAAKVTTPFSSDNPHEFDQINNWGTSELATLTEKSSIKKLIYASSVSVYGSFQQEGDINTDLNPRTFYAISKMNGEAYIKRLQNLDKKIYILRLGNIYGYSKSMRFDSVVNKFMFEANFKNQIRIFGSGNQRRSFQHIDRLTPFLQDIIHSDLKPDIYNVVENTFSVNEIVDELRLLYQKLEMIFVNQNMKMRSLKIKPDQRLIKYLPSQGYNSLNEDLKTFKKYFSFS